MVTDWLLLSRDVGTSPADPRAALCSCSTVSRSKVWTLPPNTSEEPGTSILRHQKQWQGAQTLWARCLGNQAKRLSWMRPSPLATQRTHRAHPSYADGIPHATQAPQQALRVMTYFRPRMGRTAPAGCTSCPALSSTASTWQRLFVVCTTCAHYVTPLSGSHAVFPMGCCATSQGDRLSQKRPVPKKFCLRRFLLSPSAKAVRAGKCSFRLAKTVAKPTALRSTGLPAGPQDRQARFLPVLDDLCRL